MNSAIAVAGVEKSFGDHHVLKGVDLDVHTGDMFGFLGPNGAGKSTLIRILLGLYRPDAGEASIQGKPCGGDEARQRIGFVLDRNGFYPNLSAYENLAYYYAIYRGKRNRTAVMEALEAVGLAHRADSAAGTFSTGMRQRAAIARALVHSPSVLLLDEPTSGVDLSAQVEIRAILKDVVAHTDRSVLLSSHNMDEVQRICNRIAILHNGRIQVQGDLDTLRSKAGGYEVCVELADPVSDDLVEQLRTNGGVTVRRGDGPHEMYVMASGRVPGDDLVAFLVQQGVRVRAVSGPQASLEDLYRSIVEQGGSRRESESGT